jgi:nucleoside-diphosphate-sugar epimerase
MQHTYEGGAALKVLVIGASSCFAQALIPALCADSRIDSVTGVDTRRTRFNDPKFRAVEPDPGPGALSGMLAEHDALVHLGSVALPARMTEAEMFDVNVRAAQKLFHAARSAGMRHVIHMSSAAVYGNAIHANEQSPLKPLPGFLYAEHQAQLEQLLAIELPQCVRLRPPIMVGPHAHPALKWLLRQPFYVRLPGPAPLMQCIHEDDLVRAVVLCLNTDARGPYNLASEDSFSLREAIRGRNWLQAGVPSFVAHAALRATGRLQRWGADPGLMQALSHNSLINCRRAMVELGWRSRYSAKAALAST